MKSEFAPKPSSPATPDHNTHARCRRAVAAMASDSPSSRSWLRIPTAVPLVPVYSEYDRLLVEEPLDELGGGPMDPTVDERLLVLDDASRVAAEGLAERIAARAVSMKGIVFGSVLCLAALCALAFRGVESHDASLVARFSEGMFQSSEGAEGDADSKSIHHKTARHARAPPTEVSLEERFAPRAAAMPHDDDGSAQRAVDETAGGTSKRSALRAALRGAEGSQRSRRGEAGLGRARVASTSTQTQGSEDFDQEQDTNWDDIHDIWEDEFDDSEETSRMGKQSWEDDWSARVVDDWRSGGNINDEDDDDDEFFAVSENGDSYRSQSQTGRRKHASRRKKQQDLPTVEPTSFTHGATHRAALDELEASIKNSVVEVHERRHREAKRG